MNYLDIFLITPFLFCVYKGFKKGLISIIVASHLFSSLDKSILAAVYE